MRGSRQEMQNFAKPRSCWHRLSRHKSFTVDNIGATSSFPPPISFSPSGLPLLSFFPAVTLGLFPPTNHAAKLVTPGPIIHAFEYFIPHYGGPT